MLTTEQRTTLKAAILADQALADIYAIGNLSGLAGALNAPATPAYTVHRTHVECMEVMRNGFVWSEIKTLASGSLEIWKMMLAVGWFDPSKPNVRDGLETAFGKNSATMTAMAPHLVESASVIEKLFATGTGTAVSPGTRAYQGPVSYLELIGL